VISGDAVAPLFPDCRRYVQNRRIRRRCTALRPDATWTACEECIKLCTIEKNAKAMEWSRARTTCDDSTRSDPLRDYTCQL